MKNIRLNFEYSSPDLLIDGGIEITLSGLDMQHIRKAQSIIENDLNGVPDARITFAPSSDILFDDPDFELGSEQFIVSNEGIVYRAFNEWESSQYVESEAFKLDE